MNVEQAATQREALGSPARLRICRALVRAGHAGLPVRRLQERVGIPAASTLSHHLHRRILTGLVSQERQATTLICRAVHPAMTDLVGFLAEACCGGPPPVGADACCAADAEAKLAAGTGCGRGVPA